MTATTLGPGDLAITSSTLGNPPYQELLDSAAAAGFRGLSIWPAHVYSPARASGLSDDELRRRLDDAGVVVTDVDCAVVWAGPDDPGGPYFEEPDLETLLRAATALETPLVNTLIVGGREATVEQAADAVGQLCDRLDPLGLTAMIEFSRGTIARNLETALQIIESARRPNLGLEIDVWHVHWGAATIDEISAVPGGLIRGIQFNDAPAERPDDLWRATRYERLVPGEGAIDLNGIVGACRAAGAGCPVTVEVFNQPLLDELGHAELAKRLASAAAPFVERNGE